MADSKHPFLICKREQFPELRARAAREPWKTMAADALAVAGREIDTDHPTRIHRHIGARALAYILEPDKADRHARRVREAITGPFAKIDFNPEVAWYGTVPPMGAAFVAIVALDIVYDDLSAEEVAACEAVIEKQIARIPRKGSWPAARYGTHGTWDIYKGKRTEPDDAYYANFMRQMTDDGISTVSPNYAFARLGGGDGRLQKSAYADVLEFTGIDNRYYDNERLARFYRWLLGHSVDPARNFHLFGDCTPYWRPPNALLLWRIGRFDQTAARYAAWLLNGQKPRGHVVSYILTTEPLGEPLVPGSKLFPKGGAVFREEADDPNGLGGLLYNITGRPEWHTHEEVNAISVSAYGNRLLVNGGWLGDGMRPPQKNNTLTVDGRRHGDRAGAGLSEGLLGEGLDYACGDSGEALGEGDAFRRSFILIHGQDGCPGYFAVFDEVAADANETVDAYFQLASESAAEAVAEGAEYLAAVDHHAESPGVKLSLLLASAPRAVTQDRVESGFLERAERSGYHYRIAAEYATDADGNARTVTVLFPHDRSHPKADLKAVGGEGHTGATVAFADGTGDLIVQPTGAGEVAVDDAAFAGAAMLLRRTAEGEAAFYFARRARKLAAGEVGFQADRPITIHVKGSAGRVVSEGAKVTFHAPGLSAVEIDGKPAPAPAAKPNAKPNAVTCDLPAGQHRIDFRCK